MFGYIKTYKPEMKIREFDAYKAVYCTLCKQLRKDYGIFARFTLNFDYTFLAMIRMSAKDGNVVVKKGRCPFNPMAKCNHVCCEDDSLGFSAAVAMFMVYYKLKDVCEDECLFKRVLAYIVMPFASRWRKKAAKRYPTAEKIIATFSEQQQLAEQSRATGLDLFCHPTAQALGEIFSFEVLDSDLKQSMYGIGYNVGKWVYLIDALDDWSEDLKKGRFNPYRRRLGDTVAWEEVVAFSRRQLNVCIDEACFAFDKIDAKRFRPIIHNILTLGMPEVQNSVFRKVNEK